jgi:hypothetical protein
MANIRTGIRFQKALPLRRRRAGRCGDRIRGNRPIACHRAPQRVDVGFYAYRRMEVENAAEAGAQKAWNTCNDPSSMLPATQLNASGSPNCPGLNAAITTAIQSTTLGTAVSLASGYPAEGYYCVNASNVLQLVGAVSSPEPANCSAAGNATATPGDYLQVGVTCPYQSLFPFSVMSAPVISSKASPITKTSWMRMG